ncbi:MAG: class I SAM-dependent DNA methyltransferase [Clostridiaceae bacterium]|nr:class I SAM-dependent DNA methyltransferase [Clostridiaceae bacterium]
MLRWTEIESRAVQFQKQWKNCIGDERQEAQTFEKDLMNVFGVDFRDGLHEYQIRLKDGSIGYIDYLIPGKILIEMKSKGKSLTRAYSQAMDYIHALKPEEIPKLVMVCDFNKIEVYNLEKDHRYKPFKVTQLKQHVRIFGIIAGYGTTDETQTEIELNTDASYKMAKIHDALKENGYIGHNLEVYLVRLLFCLFADDTGIFEKGSFQKYISESKEDGSDLSMRIMLLFSILDTPKDQRMTNLSEELNRFRYINGHLFSEKLPPAFFDKKMRQIILECCDFNWSEISPAIFGAMFQGIMDQDKRRELGAHYTSEENIMKVIGPLFLDDLYDEFERSKNTIKELNLFHDKIANLKFLDPACGSGNFLILTYQKLRELEFEILKYLYDMGVNQQMAMINAIYTRVHINQFYGIEYEDFACEIAKVSILLMKHLMDQEVSNYFGMNIIDFPIKENASIIYGNALQLEWDDLTAGNLNYILGNPPFIGAEYQTKEQKNDMRALFGKKAKLKNLDYVASWFIKAMQVMNNNIWVKAAFVSTNSITQGEQVETLWTHLLNNDIIIDFAYKTFKWSNEAKGKAAVHCVIIGFSKAYNNSNHKYLYSSNGTLTNGKNISPYLVDAPNVIVNEARSSLGGMPKMMKGNQPTEGGFLLLSSEEKEELLSKDPKAEQWIKRFMGAREFIQGKERYCLWFADADIREVRKHPLLMKRIENVREMRLASSDAGTRKKADTPWLFRETNNPEKSLVVPATSSEKRRYIPIGYVDQSVILSNAVLTVPDGDLVLYALLTSNVHMAWMRVVAGRLKSDYRYSAFIVYNTFPFPKLEDNMKLKLEKTAGNILKARELYSDWTLGDLYDDTIMPPELRRAHIANDRVVWETYGKIWNITSEEDCIAYLMKRYKELTQEN